MKHYKLKSVCFLLIFFCLLGTSGFGNVISVSATEETSQITEIPEVTEIPILTEVPSLTDTPELTPTPSLTDTPILTEVPLLTDTPEITLPPSLTEVPTATPTPAICHMTFYDEDGVTQLFPAISKIKTSNAQEMYWDVILPIPERKGYTFYSWAKLTNKNEKYGLEHFKNDLSEKMSI